MDVDSYRYDGRKKFSQKAFDPAAATGVKDRQDAEQRLAQNKLAIQQWQQKLFAEERQSLLVVLQAMDAAGKDGAISHVFGGVNPAGVHVANFRQPCRGEAAHDFLWRVHKQAPAKGWIGIFNRSHYESVLIEKVLDLPRENGLPAHSLKDIWKKRYRQICDFEQMLAENGTTVVKFYLNISAEQQRRRFLSRLDEPGKNWKFSKGDLETSAHWDDYMKAFEDCVNNTARPFAPWYVVPANKKWYARLVISEVVLQSLAAMQPAYPAVTAADEAEMAQCRPILEDAAHWPYNIKFD